MVAVFCDDPQSVAPELSRSHAAFEMPAPAVLAGGRHAVPSDTAPEALVTELWVALKG